MARRDGSRQRAGAHDRSPRRRIEDELANSASPPTRAPLLMRGSLWRRRERVS